MVDLLRSIEFVKAFLFDTMDSEADGEFDTVVGKE